MQLTLIASLVSALFAGAVGYGTASHFADIKITQMELDNANVRIALQRASRATTERLTAAVTQAQDEAQRRSVVLQRDRDSAAQSASGMLNASTVAVRASTDNPETCRNITVTYDIILSESRDFIQSLAADADQCDIERKALDQGWATNPPQSR